MSTAALYTCCHRACQVDLHTYHFRFSFLETVCSTRTLALPAESHSCSVNEKATTFVATC
jgi:hypothetical protein